MSWLHLLSYLLIYTSIYSSKSTNYCLFTLWTYVKHSVWCWSTVWALIYCVNVRRRIQPHPFAHGLAHVNIDQRIFLCMDYNTSSTVHGRNQVYFYMIKMSQLLLYSCKVPAEMNYSIKYSFFLQVLLSKFDLQCHKILCDKTRYLFNPLLAIQLVCCWATSVKMDPLSSEPCWSPLKALHFLDLEPVCVIFNAPGWPIRGTGGHWHLTDTEVFTAHLSLTFF